MVGRRISGPSVVGTSRGLPPVPSKEERCRITNLPKTALIPAIVLSYGAGGVGCFA